MDKLNQKRANLTEIVNVFKAEFPKGYKSLLGYSGFEFDIEVKELSCAGWLNDGEPQSYEAHKQWRADVLQDAFKANEKRNGNE